MRIVFTLGGTDLGRSGLGTYVRGVLPPLRDLAASWGDQLLALGTAQEFDAYEESLSGIEHLEAPSWTEQPGQGALWYMFAAGRRARASGDVMLYSAANRRFGALNPLPSVAVVHDLGQLHVPHKYDALRMAYFRHALLRGLRRAHRVVAISHATRDDVVQATGLTIDEVDVVRNGVDAERFVAAAARPASRKRARVRVGLSDNEPYLLYPARLEHPAKNHVRLIEAFARSRAAGSHRLVLVGGDWGARGHIEAAVTKFGVRSRVIVGGYIEDELMPPLVGDADAVVMAGLWEGFGLPALEALAAGRTVCCSATGALPEVVGDLGSSFQPTDVDSIQDALDRALFDQELRKRCAQEGPDRAAHHSWRQTALGLLRNCHRAAGSDTPSALAAVVTPAIPNSARLL